MYEEIYQQINQYRKKSLNWIFFIGILNIGLTGYLIYHLVNHGATIFLLIYIIVFIIDFIGLLVILVVYNKKINQIQDDNLVPVIIRQVNTSWSLREPFNKEEELNSLIIDKSGSFSSSRKIVGSEDGITYAFAFIRNIISSGQTSYDFFSGTYITFKLPKTYPGLIQVRDKGRPARNKKLNLNCEKYDTMTQGNKDFKFYTNNPKLAGEWFTNDFIQFYYDLRTMFNKNVYMTLINDRFILGIHNRKDFNHFGLFTKITQLKIDERIQELKKIEELINNVCKYINFKLED